MEGLALVGDVRSILRRLARLDAHQRVIAALVVAGVASLLLCRHPLWTVALASYDAFAFVSLVLVWITIVLTPGQEIRAVAKVQDFGRTVIFAFVVVAACAALFAVAFLIHNGRAELKHHFSEHVALAVLTIALAWLLVHTVFGLRYAHNFYGDSKAAEGHAGGLAFPGEHPPDYGDFAYFSFVIGMTCQVSDVQITAREMRRLALIHGVLAFAFNTAILALTINTVSALL